MPKFLVFLFKCIVIFLELPIFETFPLTLMSLIPVSIIILIGIALTTCRGHDFYSKIVI